MELPLPATSIDDRHAFESPVEREDMMGLRPDHYHKYKRICRRSRSPSRGRGTPRSVRKRATLETLGPRPMTIIMSMLESVASLRAIVRASPAFHRVYAETRPECLKLVLYRAIGPEELPYALGALRASMVQDPRRPLPLPRFFVRDRRSDADNANVWGPFICRSGRWRTVAPAYLVTLLRMASCVDFFVHSFVRTSARAVSSHLQITVAQRLYQFQLCCIFAAREWIPIRAGAVGITNRYFSYQLGRDSAAHMETISMFLVTRIEPVLARVLCEWTEGRPGPWSRFHDFPDFTQPGPDAEDFKRALVLQGLPRLRLFITTPDDRKRQCMILETLVALWGHRMNPPLAEITV